MAHRKALRRLRPTARYVMETEVHVYAFSIAANILLSLFPFLIVMVSLCRYALGWQAAEEAIYFALREYFPEEMGSFILRNLKATVESRGPFQVVSILLLLFTANGIFEPLEVALNRAWGIATNRSYFRNQLVSLGLIFACGTMALFSISLTAYGETMWNARGDGVAARFGSLTGLLLLKLAVIPMSMLLLFLIYWLLPNGRIPARRVLPVSVVVGLALELLKNVMVAIAPWLRAKLVKEYGPFVNSVNIILWGTLAAMVMLAGAQWSARGARDEEIAAAGESSSAGD
jgi:membrane protein